MFPKALLSSQWLWNPVPWFIIYNSGVTEFSRFTELFLHRPLHLLAEETWISKKTSSKSLILLASFSLHLWDLTNWIYIFHSRQLQRCEVHAAMLSKKGLQVKLSRGGWSVRAFPLPIYISMTAPGFTHPAQLSLPPVLSPLPLWSYRKLCICSLCSPASCIQACLCLWSSLPRESRPLVKSCPVPKTQLSHSAVMIFMLNYWTHTNTCYFKLSFYSSVDLTYLSFTPSKNKLAEVRVKTLLSSLCPMILDM